MTDLVLPVVDERVRQIWLDDRAELFCVVDVQDYDFAMQWKWKAIKSKGRKVKWYAYRTTRDKERHVAVFLHKLICLRANGLPPSTDHLIGDHQDGDSLNNRRVNLEWSTRSQNCLNRNGIAYQQLRLAILTQDQSRVLKINSRGGQA